MIGVSKEGEEGILDDALDLEEALEVCDLEETNDKENTRLEQGPPDNTPVRALGSY